MNVMLRRGSTGTFRRVLRDKDAEPVGGVLPALKDETGAERTVVFNAGEVKDLSAEELEAVRDDIGKGLSIAKVDDESKPVPKPDDEATAKFVKETAELRAREQKERFAAKDAKAADVNAAGKNLAASAAKAVPPRRTTTATPGDKLETKDK